MFHVLAGMPLPVGTVLVPGGGITMASWRENTQFLGVSGGYVMWMDVTSRERDIIKYALPPL